MKCKYCGTKLGKGIEVCPKCGRMHKSIFNSLIAAFKDYRQSNVVEEGYVWKRTYSWKQIRTIEISSGNCPIKHFEYDGKKIIGQNKINGSRDGGRNFPWGFFDKNLVYLTDEENRKIRQLLSEMNFEHWKTDPIIHENRYSIGFCASENFFAELSNGEKFCFESTGKTPDGFKKLKKKT